MLSQVTSRRGFFGSLVGAIIARYVKPKKLLLPRDWYGRTAMATKGSFDTWKTECTCKPGNADSNVNTLIPCPIHSDMFERRETIFHNAHLDGVKLIHPVNILDGGSGV